MLTYKYVNEGLKKLAEQDLERLKNRGLQRRKRGLRRRRLQGRSFISNGESISSIIMRLTYYYGKLPALRSILHGLQLNNSLESALVGSHLIPLDQNDH